MRTDAAVLQRASGDRIRVMHIVDGLTRGGIPSVVSTLCEHVDNDRYDLSVTCINFAGPVADDLRGRGTAVHQAELAPKYGRYVAFRSIARILRRHPVDVVHTHNTQAMLDGTFGARLARVGTVVHTDHARLYPDKARYLAAEYLASHFVHRIVGVSDHTSAALVRHNRFSPAKVVTIPNGISVDRVTRGIDAAAKRRELGLSATQPVLGIGARLEPQKAHLELLESVRLVVEQQPDVVLLIAGEGSLEGQIRSRVRELGLENNVRLLGVRADMGELLQMFDVFVLSSLWEGLPMVLLEALAVGCPVVASSVGGVPTAIRNEDTGLTVPPSNPQLFADAVLRMLRDGALRERVKAQGRILFEQRFTARAMALEYERLYAAAAASTVGRRGAAPAARNVAAPAHA